MARLLGHAVERRLATQLKAGSVRHFPGEEEARILTRGQLGRAAARVDAAARSANRTPEVTTRRLSVGFALGQWRPDCASLEPTASVAASDRLRILILVIAHDGLFRNGAASCTRGAVVVHGACARRGSSLADTDSTRAVLALRLSRAQKLRNQ